MGEKYAFLDRRHVLTAIASRLSRIGRTCAPPGIHVNLGKASSLRPDALPTRSFRLSGVTDRYHAFRSERWNPFFRLFSLPPSFYISSYLSPVTRGDMNVDDIPTEGRLTALSRFPWRSRSLHAAAAGSNCSFLLFRARAQHPRNTTAFYPCFINFPPPRLLIDRYEARAGGSLRRQPRQKNFKFPSIQVALSRNFNIFARNGPLLHAHYAPLRARGLPREDL